MFVLNKNKGNNVRLEVPISDFIPYACHYSPDTILTKNGELLQTIKIVGFSHGVLDNDNLDLRTTVRKAILENVKSDRYSIWFHTVRRKKSLDPGGDYDNLFVKTTHDAWCKKNYWRDKYVNELYITIISQGKPLAINSIKDLIASFSISAQRNSHLSGLDESHSGLSELVNNLLTSLSSFGAQRLTILEDEEGASSEILQFLDKIIHLNERRIAVPLGDLSKYLATGQIAFGNNAFEVRGDNKKFFGSILSIKEYHEIPAKALDAFLQLPHEFVITECMEFANANKVLKQFKYQERILKLSGDEEFASYSDIKDILNSNTGSSTDFGYHQITITLIAEDLKKLDEEIAKSFKAWAKLGIITVREDLNMENCFWSQLPANFSFICRKSSINTSAIGGLASLHNFPAGKMSNPWGSAVTLFRTVQGTPYFFNFHQQQVGHTLILGPHASGKSTLTNFLLSESFKYHPKILVIDHHKRTELLFKATGNLYKQVGLNSNTPNYNPLLLPDNEENRAFLRKWFSYLINQHSDEYKTENEQLIAQAVNLLYELPVEMRQLKHLERLFPPGEDQGCQRIIKALEIWRGEGKFSQLFDNEQDIFEQLDNNIVAFDITNLYENKAEVVLPLVMYYFHRFSNWLDGKPAIIVINDAFEIFENQGFNTEILPWLDYLSTKSAICIMTSEIKTGKTIPLWHEEIVRKCATHIFLPNNAAINFPKLFNLTIKECEMAKSMTTLSRHFLLKQGKDTIMAELNLAGLENITAILSGQEQTAIQIEEIVKEAGEDPDKWLPIFYERYK